MEQLNQTYDRQLSNFKKIDEIGLKLYQENAELIFGILKFFMHSSYLSSSLKTIANTIIDDYSLYLFEKYGKAYCLHILYEFILNTEIPIKTEPELTELSKEELFSLVLKDKFNISIYDISTACNVSLGTTRLRLALARTKAFLGGVPLTLKTNHNCYEFQNDIEENATVENINKYKIDQSACAKCQDFLFKKKQSLDFFSTIHSEQLPEHLKEVHHTPIFTKEGSKFKIQISTAPWYYKILFEGLIASAIMIVLVFAVPAVKKIYEFWLEKRVDIYNLADFAATSSLSTDPTIATPKSLLQNNESINTAPAPQAEPSLAAQTQPNQIPVKAENEFIGKESERLSSNKVYRILIKTDSPENLKASILSAIQLIQFQRPANTELISDLPGGVLFDLFIPFDQYKPLLSTISQYGEIKVIITQSKEKGISGKARLKIWLQKI